VVPAAVEECEMIRVGEGSQYMIVFWIGKDKFAMNGKKGAVALMPFVKGMVDEAFTFESVAEAEKYISDCRDYWQELGVKDLFGILKWEIVESGTVQ